MHALVLFKLITSQTTASNVIPSSALNDESAVFVAALSVFNVDHEVAALPRRVA
jgi:hypothetical protein